MTIRMPFWQRAPIVLTAFTAAAIPAYAYVVSHDLGRTVRQFTAGKPVTWPPAPKPGARGGTDGPAHPSWSTRCSGPLRLAGLAALALGAVLCWPRAASPPPRGPRAGHLRAAPGPRRPVQPVPRPGGLRGHRGGHLGALVPAAVGRPGPLRARGPPAARQHRSASPWPPPRRLVPAIAGPLEDLYPDVRLIEQPGRPAWAAAVTRLKKRRSHVLSLQTTRNYEHAFAESLAALLGQHEGQHHRAAGAHPGPRARARAARGGCSNAANAASTRAIAATRSTPACDSVVEAKELKGALETQHRSLCYFDLRVAGDDPAAVRRVAGLFGQLRSENELVRRDIRLRRAPLRPPRRARAAQPAARPAHRASLSTSELATLWQLPRARAKLPSIPRATMRRAVAPPEIAREPELELMRDEHGPVGLAPDDRKYGHALIGGQGEARPACLARHWAIAAADPERAAVLIDGKGPLAEAAIGMVPADRTVHYLDLARPEIGLQPAHHRRQPRRHRRRVRASPDRGQPARRHPSRLRQLPAPSHRRRLRRRADPTLWHVYRMLELGGRSRLPRHRRRPPRPAYPALTSPATTGAANSPP